MLKIDTLAIQFLMKKCIYIYTVLIVGLAACQSAQPLRVQYSSYTLIPQPSADSAITNLLNVYRNKLRDTLNTVIAYTYQNWLNKPPENALGNALADALAYTSPGTHSIPTEIALVNGKKIRGYWPKGNIRLEQFFQVLPKDDYWFVYEMTGKDLYALIKKVISVGNWSISKGMFISFREGNIVSISIQGKPLEVASCYRISVWDDNPQLHQWITSNSRMQKTSTVLVREALVQYCRQITQAGKPLTIQKEKRMYALD